MARPMRTEGRRDASRKDDVIKIRASAETKAILNQAATLRGQELSEFMLDSACRQAEEIMLDQRAFFLKPKDHEKFVAMLDSPEKPRKELRTLMRREPSWQR